ncbi:tripartite tricarboxylate transporter substrate binding protein [Variovorax paradoxus]|nr:tripartite tricarboxylate transporter substrate binding protein [Variovorax paradoxus]MBT2300985.1 tripartite tricarboxylate transporter substrate binding protein [Variovorax paradoxus]
MTPNLIKTAAFMAASAALLATAPASAETYPSKTITIVVPYVPGGNIDTTARLIGRAMGEVLKQPIVVDNRAGAGGIIGAAYVAKIKPDGYTLLLGSSATIGTAPAVYKQVAYDPLRDFTAIAGLNTVPMVLTIGSRLAGVSNFDQLVAASKKANGGISVATSGNGSSNHLALELLKRQSGFIATHVPYKGAAPALTDLLGGQVDAQIDQLNSSLPYLRDGRIKAVAQLGSKRSALLPNVPTLAEQGVKGFDAVTYTGLFAPAGVPAEVQHKLVEAVEAALKDPAVVKAFREMGAERVSLSPEAFAAFVKADTTQWRTTARDASITVE